MPDIDFNFNLDGNNDLIIVTGQDEIEQSIRKRLLTRQGELFYDTSLGLDWNQIFSIDTKIITPQITELEIRRLVLEEDNVQSLQDLTITDSTTTRNRNIKFTVILTDLTTITGEVTI